MAGLPAVLQLSASSLLGIVREPPYSLVWSNATTRDGGVVYAVATDNLGTSIPSNQASIGFADRPPPRPVPNVDLQFPRPRDYAFGSAILLQAEAYWSDNNINPVEFYAGAQLVASVLGPPYFAIVSNLPLGSYTMSATLKDLNGNVGSGQTQAIRVKGVKLDSPSMAFSRGFEFDAQLFPPGLLTLQATSNLADWISLSTNRVSGSSFHFADPGSTNYFQRYYRVRLEP